MTVLALRSSPPFHFEVDVDDKGEAWMLLVRVHASIEKVCGDGVCMLSNACSMASLMVLLLAVI